MPALTGIRFFEIFHIFLFHLWSAYDNKPDEMAGLMQGFDHASLFLHEGAAQV